MFLNKKKKPTSINDLKKGVEKAPKTQIEKKQKELKPFTKTILSGVRVVFWLFIIFIIVLGGYQLVRSKQPKIIKEIYEYMPLESESDRAKTYALSFAKAYLTYDGAENNKYRRKLNEYMTSGIKFPSLTMNTSYIKANDVMIWKVDPLDNNHSNIIVKADVTLKSLVETENSYDDMGQKIEKPKMLDKTLYLSVPIFINETEVAVNDYPAFLSVKKNISIAEDPITDEEAETSEKKKKIKAMAEDFFDIYYEGTAGQISKFMKDNQDDIYVLEGNFKFVELKEFKLYKDGADYKLYCVVDIVQQDTALHFYQRFKLEIIEHEGKFLIKKLSNRIFDNELGGEDD